MTPIPPSPTSIPIGVQHECVVGLRLEVGEACAYESDDDSRFVLAILEDGSTLLDGDVGPLSLSERVIQSGGKLCACGLETDWDGDARTITALPEPILIPDISGIEAPREPYRDECAVGLRLLAGEICDYPGTYCLFEVSTDGVGHFLGMKDSNEIEVRGFREGDLAIDFSASASNEQWVITNVLHAEIASGDDGRPLQCAMSPAVAELYDAIHSRDHNTVRQLLADGADVNGRGMYGHTPLAVAVMWVEDIETAQILLEAGADTEKRDGNGNPVIHGTAYQDSLDLIRLLVNAGADLRARAGNGDPLLFWAADAGNFELVRYLLAMGADITVRGWAGRTVLADNLARNDIEMLALLIEAGADMNALMPAGGRVLGVALASHYHDETLEFLIDAGANIHSVDGYGRPVWWRALEGERTSKLRILLDAGVNPNVCDARGNSALRRTIDRGWSSEVAAMLLDAGAEPNAQAPDGDSPLAAAIWRGHSEMIPLLVEAGADVNAMDKEGRTILELAKSASSQEIIEYLIDAGAE